MSRKTLADKINTAVQADDEPVADLPAALARRPVDKPVPSSRRRPRYPSEERRSKTTYDLATETSDAVREIAAAERLPRNHSRVAQALLDHAIAQYRAGHIALDVEQDGPRWRLVVQEREK